MIALLAALLLLSVVAMLLLYLTMRFASLRARAACVISLSGLYFVSVFALFIVYAGVFP